MIEKKDCVCFVLGQIPTLESVSNHGLCDVRQQNCMRIPATGNKFIDNQNLICKMTEATVSNSVFFNVAKMIQFVIWNIGDCKAISYHVYNLFQMFIKD